MEFYRVSFPEMCLPVIEAYSKELGRSLLVSFEKRIAIKRGKGNQYVMYCNLYDATHLVQHLDVYGKTLKGHSNERGRVDEGRALVRAGNDINLQEKLIEIVFEGSHLDLMRSEIAKLGDNTKRAFREKNATKQGARSLYRIFCSRQDALVLKEVLYKTAEKISPKGLPL